MPLDLRYISTVTLSEIRFGIELVPDAARRSDLADGLTHKVRPMFERRALPISEDVMFKWLLVEEGRKAAREAFAARHLFVIGWKGTAFDVRLEAGAVGNFRTRPPRPGRSSVMRAPRVRRAGVHR